MTTHTSYSYPDPIQWDNLQKYYPYDHVFWDNLYLDIETTGLSRERSILYMIGVGFYDVEEGAYKVIQWFNDDGASEESILTALSDLLGKKKWRIVTFNGDGFDLPWLEAHYSMNGIPCPLSDHSSIDLYKELKPYLRLFGLSHGRQKDWEAFLGIHREDQYSGGALIQVYREYLKNKKLSELHSGTNTNSTHTLLSLLLLHNREDVEGLAVLYPLLAYPALWNGDFSLGDTSDVDTDRLDYWTFTLEPFLELPKELVIGDADRQEDPLLSELILGKETSVGIPVYSGSLKHFFDNVKDYYYLPEEDRAVHKSIGMYVDKKYRRPAKRSTCYAHKEGCFLPVPLSLKKYGFACGKRLSYEDLFILYKKDYSDRRSYIEIEELIEKDRQCQDHKVLICYLTDMLHEIAISYIERRIKPWRNTRK